MITDKRLEFRPYKYQWAYDYFIKSERMHWTHLEVPMHEDIRDWQTKLSDNEKQFLTNIFRFFTTADVDIGGAYVDSYLQAFPQPEVRMMLTSFANREAVHVAAYAHLIDTLGMPESLFNEFRHYKEMVDKHAYLSEKLKDDILIQLAVFSAFAEGLQLFSSFVMLLNFQRYGLMKGMGQIISWSVSDECLMPDTEILTPSGWKKIQEVTIEDKVAQFSLETSEITFSNPSKIIKKKANGSMLKFSNPGKLKYEVVVTPNHDMVWRYDYHTKWSKKQAKDLRLDTKVQIPTSGIKKEGKSELTFLDRFRIALQADGSISKRYDGSIVGTVPVTFSFSKKRKIERFKWILKNLGFNFSETIIPKVGNRKEQIKFIVNVPIEINPKKDFAWIQFDDINHVWCRDFLEEVSYWDGYVENGEPFIYYSSVIKDNVDKVQAVASLCGYTGTIFKQEDNRSENFSDVWRIHLIPRKYKRLGKVSARQIGYYDDVHCLSMPDGTLLIRYNDSVSVTGNCVHVEAMIRVFNTLRLEFGGECNQEAIYIVADKMVELEDSFIDLVFANYEMRGLNKEELKLYIRYIADRRLLQLGLDTRYKVKDNPLPWVEEMLNAPTHGNFFETTITDYSKGIKGSWEDVWGKENTYATQI